MINTLLNHNIRKDVVRENKKLNHKEYLRALQTEHKIKYWAGYHKKKLIFFGLVAVVSWTYDIHLSAWHYLLSLRSPRQLLNHMLFGQEKVEKTVNQQKIIGWQFGDTTFDLLAKLYYETDKRLIFGLGRNYLFQVYSNMGLLQKTEDINNFWAGGGFYRKRNQLISGVSYKQFMSLYTQGFKTLRKINSQLTEQQYLKQFFELFIQKGPEIVKWEKDFNKKRYSEFLKNLVADHQKKIDEIKRIMRENIEITEEQMEQKLQDIGMKGLCLEDKWLFWKNKEILLALREYTLHNRLNLNIIDSRERFELEGRLKEIQKELLSISDKKAQLKAEYKNIYEDELI